MKEGVAGGRERGRRGIRFRRILDHHGYRLVFDLIWHRERGVKPDDLILKEF